MSVMNSIIVSVTAPMLSLWGAGGDPLTDVAVAALAPED